jgi:ubiquinone/menaquinone biosynthesis C-methylase UbiE
MSHQHSFGDAEQWAHVFDDPKRDQWQKPHEVISALALGPDSVVADIGAGTGYFSARLANMLPKGRVFAADIEPGMVRYLAERAARENLPNMTPVQARADTPGLPAKVDLVLMVDTYHHIEGREHYFRGLLGLLKPGGRVALIDFRMDSPEGPPKAARLTPAQVTAEMGAAGYEPASEQGFLPRQYFLIFRPRQPG